MPVGPVPRQRNRRTVSKPALDRSDVTEELGQSVVEYAIVVGLVSATIVGVLGLAASAWLGAIIDSLTSGLPL
jgi:Flp pilus assembly pilin Flp